MRLFWLNRNSQGLEELGHPLTEKQLRELFEDNQLKGCFDVEGFFNGDTFEESEGEVFSNETFTVREVKSLDEMKSLMTWEGFDPQESHASGNFDEEYPVFVDEKYRLSRYIYAFTGRTCSTLPFYAVTNPTYDFLVSELDLLKSETKYHPSEDELIAKEIADEIIRTGTISEEQYLKILKAHNVELERKCILVTAYPYAVQTGHIFIPNNLNAGEDIKEYLQDNWDKITFSKPNLDYCGTDFEWEEEKEN